MLRVGAALNYSIPELWIRAWTMFYIDRFLSSGRKLSELQRINDSNWYTRRFIITF